MFLHFDSKKATQAAGVVLRHLGKRTTRLRLLKLLYIADRTAIQQRGHPIVGGKVVAMDNGPLHSPVYDLIKGNHIDEPVWSQYITTDGPRDLVLTEEPGVELLSDYEINLLNETADRYNALDDYDLSVATHCFLEWCEHQRPGTSVVIPVESIVKAVCEQDEVHEVLQELRDKAVVDDLFSRTTT